jgi:hypothetical protein
MPRDPDTVVITACDKSLRPSTSCKGPYLQRGSPSLLPP